MSAANETAEISPRNFVGGVPTQWAQAMTEMQKVSERR
jgi:hypothetical protein